MRGITQGYAFWGLERLMLIFGSYLPLPKSQISSQSAETYPNSVGVKYTRGVGLRGNLRSSTEITVYLGNSGSWLL